MNVNKQTYKNRHFLFINLEQTLYYGVYPFHIVAYWINSQQHLPDDQGRPKTCGRPGTLMIWRRGPT
jgi:hypothetical protein